MGRPGFFKGQHHSDDAKRRISEGAQGKGRGGFNVKVECPNCKRKMNPANLARHTPPCLKFGNYSRKRKSLQRVLKSYGLDIERFETLVERQAGGCAICGNKPSEKRGRLDVDHDHTSNVVRGLLCSRCNLLLGFVGDSREVLMKAIQYLEARAFPAVFDPFKD